MPHQSEKIIQNQDLTKIAKDEPVLAEAIEDYRKVSSQLTKPGLNEDDRAHWLEIQTELESEIKRLAARNKSTHLD